MKIARTLVAVAFVAGFSLSAYSQESPDAKKSKAKRDELRIAVQKICPVSGQKLGAHGAPIKVAIGKAKEEVFLCCKGCLKGKIDAKHWATIHANIAKAQRICPVMKHELPKNAKWTIVDGQIVYVCCPPCTGKIAKDPKPYLQKIDDLYTASLKTRAAASPNDARREPSQPSAGP